MKFVTLQTGDSIVIKLSGTVATTQPVAIASYLDIPSTTSGGGPVSTNNTTEVTVVAAPSSGTRIVDSIRLTNMDSATIIATIQVANGGNRYTIGKFTLAAAETRDILAQKTSSFSTTLSGGRSVVSYTTASLASNAYETGSFTAPKSHNVLRLVTNYECRVRVYLSSAQRDADIGRSSNIDPSGNHGLVFEIITTPTMLTIDLSPIASSSNPTGGTTFYITINNTALTTRSLTATMTLLSVEG